jgi:lysophospholipid acyltransferase (LPLAT)-like uncharacterized protein
MIKTLLPLGLTALIRSLHFTWIGEPLPEKCIVAFWHSQMIAGWWVSRCNAVALVSKSKDGENLNSILKKWSYQTVRGSSSVSGKEALDEAMEIIRNGEARRLVITPDGPQGPREVFKRGAFIASEELELPLYFLSIKYKKAMVLPKSWDNFQIPYPFSKVVITSHLVDTGSLPTELQEQKEFLERASLHYRTFESSELTSAKG